MPIQLPAGFLFGAATAAYQVEGAADADGKGPSIWDVFCDTPGKIAAGDSGRVACDHYHRWTDDLDLMRKLNLNAYRFSVSWPRVMPTGRGAVNERGLDFYDRLVDRLCAANIEPFVTLFHWDLPAALQMELGGWAHADSAAIFADYADIIFARLSDRVRFWMTLNEPWVVVCAGYFDGVHAPGVRDRALGYRAGHNLLRAHAYAVERFRALHVSRGKITFALNSSWSFPASAAPADLAAAERALLNFGGWFGDPAWFGDYPAVMREKLGEMLPRFSDADARLLRRSMDYIAINYYTSEVVRHAAGAGVMDAEVVRQTDVPYTSMDWPVRPDGFHELLCWLGARYGDLPIYVTENGAAFEDVPDAAGFVNDRGRAQYLFDHLSAVQAAIRDGADVRGYLAWSLLDNLEWSAGFAKRFGLVRCDHATQKRTIKYSGRWYAEGIAAGEFGQP